MNNFTLEGVSTLPTETLEHFQEKKISKLQLYKEHFQKRDVFKMEHFDIYVSLDDLIPLRNRIHIQNEKKCLESDDSIAFSKTRLEESEKCLESVFRDLSVNQSRTIGGYVGDFVLPFSSHF